MLTFGRTALVFALGLGLAVACVPVVVVRLAAVLDLAAVLGRAAAAGLAVVVERAVDFAALLAGLAVLLVLAPVVLVLAAVPPDLAEDRDLAVPDFGEAAGVALAVDIVLAAAVRDLAAVVMAFVAVFIACMAVDIVLAEDVALVAAAVILVAADVTLVAADETVRAAAAVDGAELLAAVRLPLLTVVLVLALCFGRLAVRLGALPLADRARAPAGLRRAALRAVVRAGTDLPPV